MKNAQSKGNEDISFECKERRILHGGVWGGGTFSYQKSKLISEGFPTPASIQEMAPARRISNMHTTLSSRLKR